MKNASRRPEPNPPDVPADGRNGGGPEIAVVIPVFKQPGLLAEAIDSVLCQRCSRAIGCVVVDDGCPFPETAATIAMFAAMYPGRVIHLRQRNRGLSGARNRGIEFVLRAWPECRAIYFLDADNRLHPDCLKRMWQRLDGAPAEVGWVYPDIDMFGFVEHYDMSGRFVPLLLLRQNYCEAGSMARRSMLEAGIRFDETMQIGFEDWDFWLQAVARGFRGLHAPDCGFRYRRRAESMLAEAERARPVILHHMKRKHRELLRPPALLRREHAELPRFAYFPADGAAALLATDLDAADRRTVGKEAARMALVRNLVTGGRAFFPDFLAFGTHAALDSLRRSGLLHAVFWQAERALEKANFVGVVIAKDGADRCGVSRLAATPDARRIRESAVFVTTRALFEQVMRDDTDGWIRSLMHEPQPAVELIEARLPDVEEELVLPALGHLLSEAAALRRLWHARPRMDVRWRDRRWRPMPHRIARDLAGTGPLYPFVPRNRREIAFVLPVADLGGVERVVMNYAAVCRKRGYGTHLVVTESDDAALPEPFREAFDTIAFAGDAATAGWQRERAYFGAHPSAWALGGDQQDLRGLLAGMDIVLNTHAVDAHAVMNDLRRSGVQTILGLHLLEQDAFGRPAGNSHLALAYEHAYDHFAVISRQLEEWCVGQGIPASKLLRIENAPGYPSEPAAVERALAAKAARGAEPLRVLFVGRFDPQKGIDRLEEIVRRTSAGGPDVRWRVVGREVLARDHVTYPMVTALREPPASTGGELDRLYAWADVVVLPSRFEGVPLVLLEAQRFGCVALATDVGAVAECIEDGIDGLLVAEREDERVIEDFCRAIAGLHGDRESLRRLRLGAADRAARRSWEAHLAPLFAVIERSMPPCHRDAVHSPGDALC